MREILFRGKRVDNGEWVYSQTVFRFLDSFYIPAQNLKCTATRNLNPVGNISAIRCNRGNYFFKVHPETVGQFTGLTDKNGKKIFEGDIVRYYHHKKSLVPVTDIKPEEDHYGRDEESGLPLAYRTTKIIRYKGHVELDPIWGMTINLKNRCQWWRNLNYEDDSINSDRLEVIGNIHDNPELLEVGE